jgi:hypothetical protein
MLFSRLCGISYQQFPNWWGPSNVWAHPPSPRYRRRTFGVGERTANEPPVVGGGPLTDAGLKSTTRLQKGRKIENPRQSPPYSRMSAGSPSVSAPRPTWYGQRNTAERPASRCSIRRSPGVTSRLQFRSDVSVRSCSRTSTGVQEPALTAIRERS